MYIGKQIKLLRKRVGLTQVDLSKMIGFKHPQQLCNIESGKAPFPAESLLLLAESLEITNKDLKSIILKEYKKTLDEIL